MMNKLVSAVVAGAFALASVVEVSAQAVTTNRAPVVIPNYTQNGGLPKWQACRAKIVAGTSNCIVMIIGESTPAGLGAAWNASSDAGWSRATGWPSQLPVMLDQLYGIPATSHSVFGDAAQGTPTLYYQYDPRVAITTWTNTSAFGVTAGKNLWSGTVAAGRLAFNPQNTDQFPNNLVQQTDRLTIFTAGYAPTPTPDALAIDVNGGAALTTISDTSSALVKTTVSASLGTNTWGMTCTNDGSFAVGCFVAGYYAYNSAISQAIIVNASWSGSTVADWNTSGAPWSPLLAIAAVAPDLCIIQIGGNDAGADTVIATYKTDLTNIVNACKASGDVLLVTSQPADPATVTYATTVQYIQADLDVATATNVPVLNWYLSLCGNMTSTPSKACWNAGMQAGWGPENYGNSATGNPHQGPPAYATIASLLAQILAN
jgi:lysophospholipase L1-like esterase